eukprot:TRINITY_DN509_c0_g1_i4.p1 TRINITY_DN509_c0_g1~~TRINITY_DN509_c0_g1_i4.p1  ORF type:complete len:228 (+),score=70.80 TRINITY_DN509_c0_g1_i4:131-814(+)
MASLCSSLSTGAGASISTECCIQKVVSNQCVVSTSARLLPFRRGLPFPSGTSASALRKCLRVAAAVSTEQADAQKSEQQEEKKLPPSLFRLAPSKEMRMMSTTLAALPLLLAFVEAELPQGITVVTQFNDVHISEGFLKLFYMVFICVFCWGATVFASFNDEYYESSDYRDAGGNGTQYWIYQRAEEDEEAAREELLRDELKREIEESLKKVPELPAVEEDKEKELV